MLFKKGVKERGVLMVVKYSDGDISRWIINNIGAERAPTCTIYSEVRRHIFYIGNISKWDVSLVNNILIFRDENSDIVSDANVSSATKMSNMI